MTVSNSTIRVSYTGDGTSVTFFIPYLFYANTDLLVLLGGATQSAGFSVMGAGTGSGSLTFATAPTTGVNVQIVLNVPLTQLTNLVDGTAFPSATVNQVNDRATQALLRLYDLISRSIRAPDGPDVTPNLLLPAASVRANTFPSFDAGGNVVVAATLPSSTLSRATIGGFLYPQTTVENAAGVTATDLSYPLGHAFRYGADPTGAIDSTTALNATLLQSYQAGGAAPYWPAGTYLISALTITGPAQIRTDGYLTKIQQKPGLGDVVVITLSGATNPVLDYISVTGNISTDSNEFHHAVSVAGGCSHVTIKGVRGTNIRGDVVNIAGTALAPVYDVKVGQIDGTNIYRNVFSCTGAEGVEVDSITGTGYGYRLFDVEPNSLSQSPNGVRIKYARGANGQVAGANLPAGVGPVRVDYWDLDNSLLVDSSPDYAPGGISKFPTLAGNIGLIHGNDAALTIGFLKARNFQNILFISSANTQPCRVLIEGYDISGCDSGESTINSLFYVDANCQVELGGVGGSIVLAGIGKTIFNSTATGTFRLKNAKVSGGCIAANGTNCEFENVTVDATGVTGNIFAAVTKSRFDRVVITNDGSATLQNLCGSNTWTNSSGAPGILNTAPVSPHVYIDCTFNGVTYRLNSIEAAVAYNPGTITAGNRFKTTVSVPGAAVGDYCVASFADIPANADDVTINGKVTAANTATVIGINTGGSSAAFSNNTLRACVFKAT